MKTTAIIMAAGKGTRMLSDLPKVLHPFKGKPFVNSIIDNTLPAFESVVVVVGFRGDEVVAVLPEEVLVARQVEQLGTGDAVLVALNVVPDEAEVVVVIPGDLPQLDTRTLEHLLQAHQEQPFPVSLMTAITPDFADWRSAFLRFGRIVRHEDGHIERIVEYKDASEAERQLKEVNVGIYAFDAKWLRDNITSLGNHNAAGEVYLTDLIALCVQDAGGVSAVPIPDIRQGSGVNSPEELKLLEDLFA